MKEEEKESSVDGRPDTGRLPVRAVPSIRRRRLCKKHSGALDDWNSAIIAMAPAYLPIHLHTSYAVSNISVSAGNSEGLLAEVLFLACPLKSHFTYRHAGNLGVGTSTLEPGRV